MRSETRACSRAILGGHLGRQPCQKTAETQARIRLLDVDVGIAPLVVKAVTGIHLDVPERERGFADQVVDRVQGLQIERLIKRRASVLRNILRQAQPMPARGILACIGEHVFPIREGARVHGRVDEDVREPSVRRIGGRRPEPVCKEALRPSPEIRDLADVLKLMAIFQDCLPQRGLQFRHGDLGKKSYQSQKGLHGVQAEQRDGEAGPLSSDLRMSVWRRVRHGTAKLAGRVGQSGGKRDGRRRRPRYRRSPPPTTPPAISTLRVSLLSEPACGDVVGKGRFASARASGGSPQP